ncbi:MAG: hypothetical protein KIT11_10290 [Fimbriimonadaceae bacterium]|nr:hypothetical protein [Fimbriimonadaceae bacterium]QYK55710.1 MAG: hypothetical protein KF733_11960 [Fimbriimonadaceae bacterium]
MRIVPLLLVALVAAGCNSVTSTTDVSADGAFKRSVRVSVPKQGADSMSGEEPTDPATLVAWQDPGQWKVEAGETDDATFVEGTRQFATGEGAAHDFMLVNKGKEYVSCGSKVTTLPDGTVEYTEVYALTEAPKKSPVSDAFRQDLAKALGELKATEEEMATIQDEVTKALYWTMFGPADPMIGLFVTNPDGALRKIRIACGTAMLDSLRKTMGDRLDEERAVAVTREMLVSLDNKDVVNPQQEMTGPDEESEKGPDPVGITVIVRGPGKLVETNGIADPVTGEVFWSLYNVSPNVGEVVLRAVYRP